MSDQEETGANVTSLEEVFLSREFGRSSARGVIAGGGAVEVTDPPQLEEVFLSREFGRPRPPAAPASSPVDAAGEAADPEGGVIIPLGRDNTRYRAIAAASGVAAAALVVAGIASGSGQPTNPTISAQGSHGNSHGHGTGPGSPRLGVTPGTPAGSPAGTPIAAATGATATEAAATPGREAVTVAQTESPAGPGVMVEAPPGTTVTVIPTGSPGGSPGSPTPATPPPGSGGGGGNLVSSVVVLVGNTVSATGTTVTTVSSQLGRALPVASPLTNLLGSVGSTVTGLGGAVTKI